MKSVQTRRRLVEMAREHGRHVRAATHDLKVSLRWATRSLAYFPDTGDRQYDPTWWNGHADNLMDDPQLRAAVLHTLEKQPELLLDEISDAIL